jgi:polyisoprenoid-binding protein YceI
VRSIDVAGPKRRNVSDSTPEIRMHRFVVTLILFGLCSLASASDFRFDPVHSQVFFSIDHQGYSQSTGRFAIKSGFFAFDNDDWSKSKVDATIDMVSLDLGDASWSGKVKSAYLDAGTFPTARFVSTSVEKTGEKTGVVHGELTMLGRKQPVDLQITFNRAGADGYTLRYIAGFSANAKFKRSAFGLIRSAESIGDEVSIHIEVEGVRDGGAEQKANATESQR